jgi:putative aminopeptidase FrvX
MRSRPRSALAVLAAACFAVPAPAQAPDSLVLRLASMTAVTGFEDAMAESLLAALPGAALDRAGNVLWSSGSGEPVRVVLCPMDEVGWVVGAVTPQGYLTLRRVGITAMGPLFDQFLEGQRVTVFGRRGAVPGVVGVRSVHLTRGRPAASDGPFALDDASVDVGAASAAAVRALGIDVLAPVARAKRVHRYGPDQIAAPDAAARAACAALLAAVLRPSAPGGPGTVVAAFTRRRQLRWDGASFVLMEHARGVAPANVVVIGESAAEDSLGTGVVASGRDSIGVARGYQAVTTWSLPTRYTRTPVETVSLKDVAVLTARLRAFMGGDR